MKIPVPPEFATAKRVYMKATNSDSKYVLPLVFTQKRPEIKKPDTLDAFAEPIFVGLLLDLTFVSPDSDLKLYLKAKVLPNRFVELGVITPHERDVLVHGKQRLRDEIDSILRHNK